MAVQWTGQRPKTRLVVVAFIADNWGGPLLALCGHCAVAASPYETWDVWDAIIINTINN